MWLPLQLANFMEELESSGLLKEDNAPEEDVKGDTQPSADAASSQPAAAAASTAIDERQVPPAGDNIASAQPDKDAGQAAEATPTMDPAESAEAAQGGEAAEDGEAAEQQVLGSLTGCPGWHEVMDMASGKVGNLFTDPICPFQGGNAAAFTMMHLTDSDHGVDFL